VARDSCGSGLITGSNSGTDSGTDNEAAARHL
jgi:hypothetical protein